MKPTKEEIKLFTDTFNRLSKFEGQHRALRTWGLFTEEELNILPPVVCKVLLWLEEEANAVIDTQSINPNL